MTEGVLHFQALLLANEQRNAYGLRYNDYERYRKHCANRTHRLRSSLKLTHGKGREFKKLPPVKLENTQEGYLQLLLLEAERAWSYSKELSQLATKNEEKSSALKRSSTARFRRAINWATQLLSHCQALHEASRLSATDLVQATAYTLILNGRFLISRFEYEDGLIQLSVARSLLDELASRAETSRDQALAISFADEIGPEIRYSAHELGRKKAYDVDGIVSEIALQHKNEIVEGYDKLIAELEKETVGGAEGEKKKKLRPIMWEDEPVPVRNPELVDVLLRVQDAADKLKQVEQEQAERQASGKKEEGEKKGRLGKAARSKRGVAAYDAILLALSEAEDVARKLAEAQQLSAGASSTPTGTRDMQFVHAYVVYQLLSRRIQRDLLLISTLLHQSQSQSISRGEKTSNVNTSRQRKEPKVDARLFPAVVKLLDTIIQSLTQMRTLSIVDDSPDLASAVDARISFTKARRCRYLSRCYTPVKKFAESLTLLQHGTIHLRETTSLLSLLDIDPINSSEDFSFYPLSINSMVKGLEEELSNDNLQTKKDWFAYNGGNIDPESGKTHKKPLFFDIALNYVQLDMDRLQERAGKKLEEKKVASTTGATSRSSSSSLAPLGKPEKEEKKSTTSKTAKVEEIDRGLTPEPSTPKAGLSSLLGGWWGRK
ncbi:hypothetical protein C8Q75DRAFT_805375 [Abortiporus biennis]|nr:hypothetical protein C8Q75DRAFT_805375 [Abortiporus biennis]